MTLKQIGEKFGISLERVRQICNAALLELANYSAFRNLYFDSKSNEFSKEIRQRINNDRIDSLEVLVLANENGEKFLEDVEIDIMKLILGLKGEKYKHNIKLVCEDFSYTPEEVVSAIKIYKIAYKKYKENILKDGNSITKKIKKRVIK